MNPWVKKGKEKTEKSTKEFFFILFFYISNLHFLNKTLALQGQIQPDNREN